MKKGNDSSEGILNKGPTLLKLIEIRIKSLIFTVIYEALKMRSLTLWKSTIIILIEYMQLQGIMLDSRVIRI
jgi:hypothetical protein